MKGFVVTEQGHVVLGIQPRGTTNVTALTSSTFSMENWQHASIIVMGGIGSTATSVTLGECTGAGGTGRTAVTFRYAKDADTGGDVLDAALAVASSLTLGGTAAVFAVIELDADELTDGYPWVQVNTGVSASKDIACLVILSGGRYQEDITATVLS